MFDEKALIVHDEPRAALAVPGVPAAVPHALARGALSLAIGVVAGLLAAYFHGVFGFSDFDQVVTAGRDLLAHRDPYVRSLYYPMPTVILAFPVGLMTSFALVPASALFAAVSFAGLAYVLSARGWWPLAMLATYPALNALHVAQWSPILTAIAVVPPLAVLALAKPTVGLAIAGAYLPSTFRWRAVWGSIAVLGLSLLVDPHWVPDWLRLVRAAPEYVPLIRRPYGFLLLLGLLRWRRPEARLLTFLALVPAAVRGYELVPLMVVPHSRREIWVFLAGASLAALAPNIVGPDLTEDFAARAQWFLCTLYLPMLVLVLRRPNEAPV